MKCDAKCVLTGKEFCHEEAVKSGKCRTHC